MPNIHLNGVVFESVGPKRRILFACWQGGFIKKSQIVKNLKFVVSSNLIMKEMPKVTQFRYMLWKATVEVMMSIVNPPSKQQ